MISRFRPLIVAACAPVGWDPRLLEAQVFVESGDDPWAFRYEHQYFLDYLKDKPAVKGYALGPVAACSYGLLQILWETATETDATLLQPWDLFHPATNLRVGLSHLMYLHTRIRGSVEATLAAYNGGVSGNLYPPYRNAGYVAKVFAQEAQLDADGGRA